MRTRKEMKRSAKKVVGHHYVLLVFTCVFISFVGTEFSNSVSFMRQTTDITDMDEGSNGNMKTSTAMSELNTANVLRNTLQSKSVKEGEDQANSLKKQLINNSKNKNSALGRSRGVLASLVNDFTSGSIFVTVIAGFNSIFKSENIAVMIFILLSILLMVVVWIFFKNMLGAVIRRIFLESRTYEKVPVAQFVFFFRVKKWMQVSWVMFVKYLYQFFWMLTIVGGIIKHYSYAMVPYVIAENPTLKAKEAITLSRKLMDGYKWKCFVLDLTFLGWKILGFITMGISDIFFVNPYIIATYSELYADLRRQVIEKKINGYELLNDTYLFEKATEEDIKKVYTDVIVMMGEPEDEVDQLKGIFGFIANVFGVIPVYGKHEKAYEKNEVRKAQISRYTDILNGKSYPIRLFTIPETQRRKKVSQMRYLRRYSVWSVILLFFSFSLMGWIWEVSLHLIADGQFVNRGVLHGPWLPIYGTGGILILLVLNKLRKKPIFEFAAATVLCGCVEYFTSYFLEKVHGQKWWDYSGYFLNLNGRICAEGLLVFGLGGVTIVYVLAPILDNQFRKIKFSTIMPICLVLTSSYLVDSVYSGKHPNTGRGITDYQSQIEIQTPTMNSKILS